MVNTNRVCTASNNGRGDLEAWERFSLTSLWVSSGLIAGISPRIEKRRDRFEKRRQDHPLTWPLPLPPSNSLRTFPF